MMRRFAIILLATPWALAQPAAEESDKNPDSAGRPVPVELRAFIDAHPDCMSFTDNCVICERDGADLHCSTPAIACVTHAPSCTSLSGVGPADATAPVNKAEQPADKGEPPAAKN